MSATGVWIMLLIWFLGYGIALRYAWRYYRKWFPKQEPTGPVVYIEEDSG